MFGFEEAVLLNRSQISWCGYYKTKKKITSKHHSKSRCAEMIKTGSGVFLRIGLRAYVKAAWGWSAMTSVTYLAA